MRSGAPGGRATSLIDQCFGGIACTNGCFATTTGELTGRALGVFSDMPQSIAPAFGEATRFATEHAPRLIAACWCEQQSRACTK